MLLEPSHRWEVLESGRVNQGMKTGGGRTVNEGRQDELMERKRTLYAGEI